MPKDTLYQHIPSALQKWIDKRARQSDTLFIAGQWCESKRGGLLATIDPSNKTVISHIAEATPLDVDAAVEAAKRALSGPWGDFSPAERQRLMLKMADILEDHFDELAYLDSIEMGMPITKSRGNLRVAVGQLRFYAGLATAIQGATIDNSLPDRVATYTLKEPAGVVGAIMAWNGPIGSFTRKIAPALAAGCTLVVKPAEEASLTALRAVELFQQLGAPQGVLNLITGDRVAGEALAKHPDVDLLTFTGSRAVGESVIRSAASNMTRTLIEVGGKSPNVVFADAELDKAAEGAAIAAFGNTGQVCSAGTRLLIDKSIYTQFIGKVVEAANRLLIGSALDPAVNLGPVASEQQLERILGYLKVGESDGANITDAGRIASSTDFERGYFVRPKILSGVDNGMPIAREEIFGPVLCTMMFRTIDEALAIANDTQFGLAAGVWTSDLKTAHVMSRNLQAGTVWINCYNQLDPAVPFGGYRGSGYGRERGVDQLLAHLETKAVWTSYA